MRLRLIDRERTSRTALPVDGVVATFRTCVRDVFFMDDDAEATHPILEDGAAYTRVLEIVCGLHSPMAGETQVQGQFKTFLDALTAPDITWLRRLGQQILSDARVIREQHLRGLGSGGGAPGTLPSEAELPALIQADRQVLTDRDDSPLGNHIAYWPHAFPIYDHAIVALSDIGRHLPPWLHVAGNYLGKRGVSDLI